MPKPLQLASARHRASARMAVPSCPELRTAGRHLGLRSLCRVPHTPKLRVGFWVCLCSAAFRGGCSSRLQQTKLSCAPVSLVHSSTLLLFHFFLFSFESRSCSRTLIP